MDTNTKSTKLAHKLPNSGGNEDISLLIQQLVFRSVQRQVWDIGSWRNALKAAESSIPRRTKLYDLYDDLLLDGHLFSVVQKRINAVCNSEWEFTRNGKVIASVNDLIDTPEFEDLITEIMNARFWGYTMIEIEKVFPDGFSMFTVPRKHMRPETGIVATEQSGDTGVNIREGIYANTVMEVGKQKDLGILKIVAQYVVYKRGGFGDWAQFAELFGMPFRKGTYDGYDDAMRVKLEDALKEAGSASYAVIPEGSNIEFIANNSNGDGKLYEMLKTACNQEISVAILGQTETTTSSPTSGYAQSKTHADVEDGINKGDRKYVRRVLNKFFIKILQAHGINTQNGSFRIKGEGEEKLSKKETFEILKSAINDLKLPVDDNYIYETYGIPKPTNYDELKRIAQEKSEKEEEQKKEEVQQEKKKVKLASDFTRETFGEWLKSFFDQAPNRRG